MFLALLSIIVLVLVIVVANVRKLNLGVVAICGTVVLGVMGGLSAKDIVGGFNTTLFIRSLAIGALIVAAKSNGTLSYMSQKIMKISCGRGIRFMPIVLYALMVTAEFLGMNLNSLLIPLMVALAYEMGLDVLKLLYIALLSMLGGGQALFASPGIYLNSHAAEAGIQIQGWNISILATIAYTILFFAGYFAFGWYKEKPLVEKGTESVNPKLNWQQAVTLICFLAMIIGVVILKLDIMVVPIIGVVVLMAIGACDPDEVVKKMPYNALIIIAGMTMLTGVMKKLGGSELMASAITSFSTAFMIRPLLSIVSSGMSIVASASTVVQPALIPALPTIGEAFPSISMQSLVAAVGIGSYATAISPMSSSGLQVMAAYDAVYQPNGKSRLALFNKLLFLAIGNAIIQMILAATGYYGIQIIP